MPAHLKKSHQNRGLLLQFVFSSFLSAASEVEALRKMPYPAAKQAMTESLLKLAGSWPEGIRVVNWGEGEGLLTKLRHVSDLLAAEMDSELADLLYEACDKAWMDSLESLDSVQEGEADFLNEALPRLHELLHDSGLILAEIAKEFPDEENLLYFLLRHSQDLDQLMGKGYVRSLFQELFPEGLDTARKFLIEKYEQRGFTERLPDISERFLSLT